MGVGRPSPAVTEAVSKEAPFSAVQNYVGSMGPGSCGKSWHRGGEGNSGCGEGVKIYTGVLLQAQGAGLVRWCRPETAEKGADFCT